MDRELSKDQQIEQLIRQGQNSRAFLENEATSLRQKLDVPARLRSSLKSHPTGWLFGSAASGLAASLLFRRKPATSAQHERAFPLKILGLILTLARPMAKLWLTGQLKSYLANPSRNSVFTRTQEDITPSPTSTRINPYHG